MGAAMACRDTCGSPRAPTWTATIRATTTTAASSFPVCPPKGTVVARGPDNEPLVADFRPVARLAEGVIE